jgi:hypothetical protein
MKSFVLIFIAIVLELRRRSLRAHGFTVRAL